MKDLEKIADRMDAALAKFERQEDMAKMAAGWARLAELLGRIVEANLGNIRECWNYTHDPESGDLEEPFVHLKIDGRSEIRIEPDGETFLCRINWGRTKRMDASTLLARLEAMSKAAKEGK